MPFVFSYSFLVCCHQNQLNNKNIVEGFYNITDTK